MRNDGRSGVPDSWSVYLRTETSAPPRRRPPHTAAACGATLRCGAQGPLRHPGRYRRGCDWGLAAGLPGRLRARRRSRRTHEFELLTRVYAASVEFYSNVFGWDTQGAGDTDESRYTTLGEGGGTAVAGIRDATSVLPSGARSAWNVSFGVKDCAATIAQARNSAGRSPPRSANRPTAGSPNWSTRAVSRSSRPADVASAPLAAWSGSLPRAGGAQRTGHACLPTVCEGPIDASPTHTTAVCMRWTGGYCGACNRRVWGWICSNR